MNETEQGSPERLPRAYGAEISKRTEMRRSVSLPMATHECRGGVDFPIFSRHATGVRLALFHRPADSVSWVLPCSSAIDELPDAA